MKGEYSMGNSKVYFCNFRTRPGLGLLDKLKILVEKANIENLNFEGNLVAIKIHFIVNLVNIIIKKG